MTREKSFLSVDVIPPYQRGLFHLLITGIQSHGMLAELAPAKKWLRYLLLAALLATTPAFAQQVSDPDFSTRVEHPAFMKRHPRVGIDEAHRNFHTRNGRYKPFADLMQSDGFVVAAAPVLSASELKSIDVLIISNAMREDQQRGAMGSAFTPEEWDLPEDSDRHQ